MIEWKREDGDRRIKKKFCLLPHYCQHKLYVWLDFRYEFQVFRSGEQYMSVRWRTEATLSSSQYKEFCKDLAVHLVDPKPEYREYAKIILEKKEKK